MAVEDTGLGMCAHCNGMAGLGEVCCHISAALFTLEINTKLKDGSRRHRTGMAGLGEVCCHMAD